MAFIGTNHDVSIFGRLRIWAEGGMVCMEDAQDNSYVRVHPKAALKRVGAINDMIGKVTDQAFYADVIAKHQAFIDQVCHIIKKAQEQGTFDDPTAERSARLARTASVMVPRQLSLD